VSYGPRTRDRDRALGARPATADVLMSSSTGWGEVTPRPAERQIREVGPQPVTDAPDPIGLFREWAVLAARSTFRSPTRPGSRPSISEGTLRCAWCWSVRPMSAIRLLHESREPEGARALGRRRRNARTREEGAPARSASGGPRSRSRCAWKAGQAGVGRRGGCVLGRRARGIRR